MNPNNNISQELLETIERYYNDSMSTDERHLFVEKLESNPEFKTQVEDIKILFLGIETQSLKEQLDEFHKDIPKATSKIRFLQFTKYAVAAVVVISLGSYWFFGKPSNQKLYAKYFTPDPGLPTTMSSSLNFEFYDAMVNYKHGDYELAISKWEKLQINKPNNDTINYFLGVAQLANKNELKAIPYLKSTIQKPESVFLNDAHYYLGLAYLKEGNIERARKHLDLSNTDVGQELISKLTD
ncbi:hypothetical protein L3X39_07935 [Sabulilitoribacter multivorans]|uniref:Tetratricopeptide repeat-containing protein n=1 Tax=Flaviramulus multivorans TaxID=1304750 RepID=A0ABS9IIN4_9FLAO|nr:tetratricopeptide repeat protein [Flaviramulus multivorans]MCF7560564.1 hypothetical protein [Flaviramulus multivorans]